MPELFQPKVSVCIQTYNHESYISQALESVLDQKTDFPIEIIVGEDDSNDRTREIVRRYAEAHPGLIRPFYNDRKNVIYVNGRATGRWNFLNNIRHARGEYIALLEGDDYWIDDEKLQKQVTFLDEHHNYSMCFTNARIWNEEHSKFDSTRFCETFSRNELIQTVNFSDMVRGHWIPTGSLVYRRTHFRNVPVWFYQLPMGDWGLFLLLLDKGPGRFFDECSSVYRIHATSYWSSLPQKERVDGALRFLEIVRNEFGKQNGIALNQYYWHLCIRKHEDMKGMINKCFLYFYRVRYKISEVFSGKKLTNGS